MAGYYATPRVILKMTNPVMEARATTQELRETLPCLCVDLDGTLVQTDTLIESVLAYVRIRPWRLLRVIAWLFLGKARFKQELGRSVKLQADSLPYAGPLLEYIETESKRGRKILLVTAADSSIAIPVAEHLGFFAKVICNEGRQNISGKTKLETIRRVLGNDEFSYAGNSRQDLAVWKGAKTAVIVGAPSGVRRAVERSGVTIEKVFPGRRFSLRTLVKATRAYQWTKNALVLVPIVLGHRLLDRVAVTRGVRAFLAFSLCASAIYLINDLLDLTTDRRHVRKRHRPLAAGQLSIPAAVLMVVILFVGAAFLNPSWDAAFVLALYVVSAIAYSLYLKRLLMIDVITLASFYTLRLFYGGAATGISVSIWTLAFSMFMFLSLALIKRISELRSRTSEEGLTASGRGYHMGDLEQLTSLCAASGLVSALIVILYVRSPEVAPLYTRPQLLLGIFPLLAYWQSRLLILANRGAIHEDPILFSLSDRASLAVVAALLAVVAAAV
jgi:4-hydroxybenzoate polyprenyltransferase/phosphoserine phosphatase